uniref:Putative secreted protein n=1 Tax=Rhipicephalus microplus TaxID=6941 RepID=A0A6G5A2W1_RHIMP
MRHWTFKVVVYSKKGAHLLPLLLILTSATHRSRCLLSPHASQATLLTAAPLIPPTETARFQACNGQLLFHANNRRTGSVYGSACRHLRLGLGLSLSCCKDIDLAQVKLLIRRTHNLTASKAALTRSAATEHLPVTVY